MALGGGAIQAFGVDKPDPASIHSWTVPHDPSVQDNRIQVTYDQPADVLTFTGMDGMDENYIQVSGPSATTRRTRPGHVHVLIG